MVLYIDSRESEENVCSDDIGDEQEQQDNNEDKPADLVTLDKQFVNDIANWPEVLTDALREDYIKCPPPSINGSLESSIIQSTDSKSKSITRKLTINAFFRTTKNGEKIKREWLVYTETSKCLYCYVCRLFSKQVTLMSKGTNDWKNIHRKLSEHENSRDHISSICMLLDRSKIAGRIDIAEEKLILNEKKYWKEVLKRVIATIKYLATYSLAFRGTNEVFFKECNGNYIGALEYLAEFDPFLKEHLKKYANLGKGCVSYMSSTICDEFINLIANNLRNKIINEIKEAKYYSIIIDSTPDQSHIDQLTVVVRYVLPSGVKERFLCFLPITSHTGKHLEEVIFAYFSELGIDIKDCRGQSYDNASNMSGKYNGLQSRIKQHSPSADFIPCASHSLNLIGNTAAECCIEAVEFFRVVQEVYVFFSSSTHRWNMLQDCCKTKHLTVKRLSDTRWSARSDAVTALQQNYQEIKKTLLLFIQNKDEKLVVQAEATGLHKKLDNFEFILLLNVWKKILERINATSKSFQKKDCSLDVAVSLFNGLVDFIQNIRDNFEIYEKEAENTKDICYKSDKKRKRIRKLFFDENSNNDVINTLTGKEAFKINVFFVICDSLIYDIKKRSQVYKNITVKFGPIFNLLNYESVREQSFEEIHKVYANDLNTTELIAEIEQFRVCIRNADITSPEALLFFLHTNRIVATFPNIDIILRIYLTMPISNAGGERSFSVLKRVKNYLRSTLSQQKLNSLSILYIEKELLHNTNFDDLIDQFVQLKIRKKKI